MKKYVYVTDWYDNAEVGSIWELVENPIVSPASTTRVYVVKNRITEPSTRWIGKCCAIVITEEENPEYFL